MPSENLRVMIVDDHEVVREGLRSLLNRKPGMTVVAEAGNVAQAIERALQEKPDVVVMDVRLPDGSGVEACREIRMNLPWCCSCRVPSGCRPDCSAWGAPAIR